MHMGRTANIIINDIIHIFSSISKNMGYFADGTALSRALVSFPSLLRPLTFLLPGSYTRYHLVWTLSGMFLGLSVVAYPLSEKKKKRKLITWRTCEWMVTLRVCVNQYWNKATHPNSHIDAVLSWFHCTLIRCGTALWWTHSRADIYWSGGDPRWD